MNYLIVAIVCIIALAIGTFALFENEIFSKNRKRKFIILSIVLIFEVAIDTIAFEIDGRVAGQYEIYKLLKIIEFIVSPVIPAIYSNIISNGDFWKKIRYVYLGILIINAGMQISNLFIPLMFNINENGVYTRTTFSALYLILLGISFLLLLISANNTYIQKTTSINATLYSILFFILFGVIVRAVKSEANSDWLCMTISYFIFIMYYSNSYFKMDSLTKLLNRMAFDTKFASINYTTAIIIIDANKFKSINDEYGHQNGDLALCKIAEAILKVYSRFGYCYRIGGDEFCVILKRGAIEKLISLVKEDSINAALKNLNYKLDIVISHMAKQYPMLSSGVSQGYSIYNAELISENKPSLEDVFKMADEKMYENK